MNNKTARFIRYNKDKGLRQKEIRQKEIRLKDKG